MRKEIIKKGHFVNISFRKNKIVSIGSDLFSTVPIYIENKKSLGNKEFERVAREEMKKRSEEIERRKKE